MPLALGTPGDPAVPVQYNVLPTPASPSVSPTTPPGDVQSAPFNAPLQPKRYARQQCKLLPNDENAPPENAKPPTPVKNGRRTSRYQPLTGSEPVEAKTMVVRPPGESRKALEEARAAIEAGKPKLLGTGIASPRMVEEPAPAEPPRGGRRSRRVTLEEPEEKPRRRLSERRVTLEEPAVEEPRPRRERRERPPKPNPGMGVPRPGDTMPFGFGVRAATPTFGDDFPAFGGFAPDWTIKPDIMPDAMPFPISTDMATMKVETTPRYALRASQEGFYMQPRMDLPPKGPGLRESQERFRPARELRASQERFFQQTPREGSQERLGQQTPREGSQERFFQEPAAGTEGLPPRPERVEGGLRPPTPVPTGRGRAGRGRTLARETYECMERPSSRGGDAGGRARSGSLDCPVPSARERSGSLDCPVPRLAMPSPRAESMLPQLGTPRGPSPDHRAAMAAAQGALESARQRVQQALTPRDSSLTRVAAVSFALA